MCRPGANASAWLGHEKPVCIKGDPPVPVTGPAFAGHKIDEGELPYPWVKNAFSGSGAKPQRTVSWKDHRGWCEKIWQEGPREWRLKYVVEKVRKVRNEGKSRGWGEKVPQFDEGRVKGVVSEIYYMHHLPSGKGYVGVAYHGALDRMQADWYGRNTEMVPSSTLMATTPFEWVCCPWNVGEGVLGKGTRCFTSGRRTGRSGGRRTETRGFRRG